MYLSIYNRMLFNETKTGKIVPYLIFLKKLDKSKPAQQMSTEVQKEAPENSMG
jgi:hypothetical protein